MIKLFFLQVSYKYAKTSNTNRNIITTFTATATAMAFGYGYGYGFRYLLYYHYEYLLCRQFWTGCQIQLGGKSWPTSVFFQNKWYEN